MRAPKKVIAAMAMATMIGGTVAPAFAAQAEGTTTFGFTQTTGVNGQKPLQTSKQYKTNKDELVAAKGDIEVNGEFTRTINNFPAETKDGHYLQVSMPITLNYTYNLDKETLTAANGKITNESVYVKQKDDGTKDVKKQPIKMSVVSLQETNKSMDNIEYVDSVSTTQNQKVQVPFELVITKHGDKFRNIHLASIKEENIDKNTFKVEANTDLDITIGQISGQKVVDNGLLKDKTASMGHRVVMQFEYLGEEE